MPQCKSCGAEIYWLKNSLSGKAAPIDAQPTPGGNVSLLVPGVYAIIPPEEAKGRTDLHRSHFATCKNAKQHRKGK